MLISYYLADHIVSIFLNLKHCISGDDLEIVIKNLKLDTFLANMSDKSKTSIDCLTKQQLVTACKKYGLRSTGTKDILKSHLKEYLSDNNIEFQVKCYTMIIYSSDQAIILHIFSCVPNLLFFLCQQLKYIKHMSYQILHFTF